MESAVSDATILLAAHPVGTEAGDVFQSDHDSYNDAIIAAKTVDSDSSATPAAVNSAISDLATATTTFNEAIITSVDQAAAQTVITQIAALPHPSTQLSTSIADNGTITDFQLPDFGYNPLPYICGADRICGIFVENGVPIGVYSGLNHWTSHPYNWSILFASNGLDANVVFGSASGEDDFYIFPLDYGETDFNDCSSNFTETCASGSEYYLSFTHTGTTPGTGWATNSLIVTNSLTLDNAQAVSDAATAYNALTPTQQSLVTNYTTLQASVIQIAALTDATAAVVNAETTPTQSNIDAANALMPAVADGPAKTSLQDRIDAVQITVDANAAATLAAAKSTAHDALTTALGTYTETDYTPDNWTTLNGFKTAGDTAIDAATDLDGVTSAQNTAISEMAGVQTIT